MKRIILFLLVIIAALSACNAPDLPPYGIVFLNPSNEPLTVYIMLTDSTYDEAYELAPHSTKNIGWDTTLAYLEVENAVGDVIKKSRWFMLSDPEQDWWPYNYFCLSPEHDIVMAKADFLYSGGDLANSLSDIQNYGYEYDLITKDFNTENLFQSRVESILPGEPLPKSMHAMGTTYVMVPIPVGLQTEEEMEPYVLEDLASREIGE